MRDMETPLIDQAIQGMHPQVRITEIPVPIITNSRVSGPCYYCLRRDQNGNDYPGTMMHPPRCPNCTALIAIEAKYKPLGR